MRIDLRKGVILVVVGLCAAIGPAPAHTSDAVIAGDQAGPIELGETRISDLKEWFGEPTASKVVSVQCIKATRMRWGRRLVVIVPRYKGRNQRVGQATVWKRTIESSRDGDLTMHTTKGLRVGDSEEKLNDLYPNRKGETHRGHTHYFLGYGENDGVLWVRVEDGTVVNLQVGPYEFC
jgi:hypothetical protein